MRHRSAFARIDRVDGKTQSRSDRILPREYFLLWVLLVRIDSRRVSSWLAAAMAFMAAGLAWWFHAIVGDKAAEIVLNTSGFFWIAGSWAGLISLGSLPLALHVQYSENHRGSLRTRFNWKTIAIWSIERMLWPIGCVWGIFFITPVFTNSSPSESLGAIVLFSVALVLTNSYVIVGRCLGIALADIKSMAMLGALATAYAPHIFTNVANPVIPTESFFVSVVCVTVLLLVGVWQARLFQKRREETVDSDALNEARHSFGRIESPVQSEQIEQARGISESSARVGLNRLVMISALIAMSMWLFLDSHQVERYGVASSLVLFSVVGPLVTLQTHSFQDWPRMHVLKWGLAPREGIKKSGNLLKQRVIRRPSWRMRTAILSAAIVTWPLLLFAFLKATDPQQGLALLFAVLLVAEAAACGWVADRAAMMGIRQETTFAGLLFASFCVVTLCRIRF